MCSLRDGVLEELLGRYLVPGDVVHLSTGDRVPADLRLLEVGVDRWNGWVWSGEWVAVSISCIVEMLS